MGYKGQETPSACTDEPLTAALRSRPRGCAWDANQPQLREVSAAPPSGRESLHTCPQEQPSHCIPMASASAPPSHILEKIQWGELLQQSKEQRIHFWPQQGHPSVTPKAQQPANMKNNQRNKAGSSSLHYVILIALTPRKYTKGYMPRATHQQVASFHRGSYFHTSFTQKKKYIYNIYIYIYNNNCTS